MANQSDFIRHSPFAYSYAMNLLLDPNNRLFTLAHSGKRLPHWLAAVVLSIGFVVIAQVGGGTPAILLIVVLSIQDIGRVSFTTPEGITQLLDTALEWTILLTLSFAPVFLLLWGWLALYEKRSLWTIGLEWQRAGWRYLRGLLAGLIMFAASIGLSAAFGFMAFEESTSVSQPQGWPALGGVFLIFLGWMVQGSAEEALARGWLLPVIGGRYRPIWGILFSSLTFAVYHSFNPNLNPFAMLNLFLFGILAAGYALREGSLWGVFGLHTAWNWAQGNLFGLEVSGLPLAGGTLFKLKEVGPDVITGGAFGPEGGLAVTMVLLMGCGLIWWASRQKV